MSWVNKRPFNDLNRVSNSNHSAHTESLYVNMPHIINLSFLNGLRYFLSKLSFQNRLLAFLLFAVTLQFLIVGGLFFHSMKNTLEYQISSKALIQAKSIAKDPFLKKALSEKNYPVVRSHIRQLRAISDADFIVIGDHKGIRIAHPNDSLIGKHMRGGDSQKALTSNTSYISHASGSMGPSIRGKASILGTDGHIIGIVSVGYLVTSISGLIIQYAFPIIVILIILMLFSFWVAWILADHIKNQMYGMEPTEIATHTLLLRSILQSTYEGTIAVSKTGEILSINKNALKFLGISKHPQSMLGRSIQEYVTPCSFFLGADPFGHYDKNETRTVRDELISCNGETLIANRVLLDEKTHSGWVTSFRRRNDFSTLTSQISQIQQHSENLRVMRHEYANKLSVIGGLIQIGAYDRALHVIQKDTKQRQDIVDFVSQAFHSKLVAGLLLGKYTRAKELGLNLQFDPICKFTHSPSKLSTDELAAILGNLLDNAFEATLKNPQSNKIITLLLMNSENELILEVADNGTGISPEISETLFEKGVSSKDTDGHGIGLYLIHQYIMQANGYILIDEAEPQGTIFSIFIPL